MEGYTQITLDQWVQWKEDIRAKLAETAGNFVYIGYRLKQIRDSGMYDGAADIFGFAEKEYGLGKSTVSRFIAINEKYSEGGNSLELKEEYRGFSSSKLAEMLTLPDSEMGLVTEKTTVREIRELKEFSRQAREAGEKAEGREQGQDPAAGPGQGMTPLGRCVADFFRNRKEVLEGVMECLREDPPGYKQAAELMAPSGQASHRKGIIFLFLYDWGTGVKYKSMAEPEPVSMGWPELLETVRDIFGAYGREDVWERFFQEQDPPREKTESVAMSQQDGEPVENREKPGTEEGRTPQPGEEMPAGQEDQIPGQMEVEDYTGVVPGGCRETGQQEETAGGSSREEGQGTDAGNGKGQDPGDSEDCGRDAGSPGQEPGVQEPYAGAGTTAAGGRGEDPGETGETDMIWAEILEGRKQLEGFLDDWEWEDPGEIREGCLEDAYRAAINVAAGLEKLVIRRERQDGSVGDAQ